MRLPVPCQRWLHRPQLLLIRPLPTHQPTPLLRLRHIRRVPTLRRLGVLQGAVLVDLPAFALAPFRGTEKPNLSSWKKEDHQWKQIQLALSTIVSQ